MSLYGKPSEATVSGSGSVTTLDAKAVLLIQYLLAVSAANAVVTLYQAWRYFAEYGVEFLPDMLRVLATSGAGIALLLLLLFKRRRVFAIALVVCPSLILFFYLPALSLSINWYEVEGLYQENFSWLVAVKGWIPSIAIFPYSLFQTESWPDFVALSLSAFRVGVMFWLLSRFNASQSGKSQNSE